MYPPAGPDFEALYQPKNGHHVIRCHKEVTENDFQTRNHIVECISVSHFPFLLIFLMSFSHLLQQVLKPAAGVPGDVRGRQDIYIVTDLMETAAWQYPLGP